MKHIVAKFVSEREVYSASGRHGIVIEDAPALLANACRTEGALKPGKVSALDDG